MPLEEGIGCLGTLLRAALEIVPEFILEVLFRICGYVGTWSVQGVTLGTVKPDPEAWTSVVLGALEIAGLIIAMLYWPW